MPAHPLRRARAASRAFNLVEILIVVVILGILAAVIVPSFAGATEESRRVAFVSELRVWIEAAELHAAREGGYPADGSSGECPAGMEAYIDADDFESGTPVGGVWDFELNENGITSAVGVHFWGGGPVQDDAYMILIDEIYDDGELATGRFRKIAAERYYAIVED